MAAAEQGQQKAGRLINDLQDISFTKIGMILLAHLCHFPPLFPAKPAANPHECWIV